MQICLIIRSVFVFMGIKNLSSSFVGDSYFYDVNYSGPFALSMHFQKICLWRSQDIIGVVEALQNIFPDFSFRCSDIMLREIGFCNNKRILKWLNDKLNTWALQTIWQHNFSAEKDLRFAPFDPRITAPFDLVMERLELQK